MSIEVRPLPRVLRVALNVMVWPWAAALAEIDPAEHVLDSIQPITGVMD